MKAAISDGRGRIWVDQVPRPEPGDYECLCRIDACASCTGTDKKLIRGQMPWAGPDKYPAVLGHESVGTVLEVGKKVRNLRPGDRVLRPAAWYNGTCEHGLYSWMAGYAEYGVVTDTAALLADDPQAKFNYYANYQQKLPEDLDIGAADATMLVTLKEIYSFIRDLAIGPGHRVAVLGAGAVGISMCFFSKLAGARVYMAARRDKPLAAGLAAGADGVVNTAREPLTETLRRLSDGGVDFILDAAGSAELLIDASAALNEHGAICSYAGNANLAASFGKLEVPVNWRYICSPPAEISAHEHLISLARMKVIPFHLFYTEVLPLDRIAEGFDRIFAGESIKTVFTMG